MVPLAGIWAMSAVAGAGALLAFALVYALSWRGGLNSDRLVLMGVGVSAGCSAVITFIIIATDPWNTGKALTWLSGSTYGRTPAQLLPVLIALVVLTPVWCWPAATWTCWRWTRTHRGCSASGWSAPGWWPWPAPPC